MWLVLSIICILLALYWVFVASAHPENFPPGPRYTALPVVGNGMEIGSNVYQGILNMREKYGDIVGFWSGPIRAVAIFDPELIDEACNMDAFSSRPYFEYSSKLRGGWDNNCPGILFSNGQNWVEQKKFVLHTLRDLGFGKSRMEEVLLEEMKKFCQHIRDTEGQEMDMRDQFQIAVINILWKILANEQNEYDDPDIRKIFKALNRMTEECSGFLFLLSVIYKPIALFCDYFNLVSVYEALREIYEFIRVKIKEHEETFQEDNMRDFMDYYIKEMNNSGELKASFHGAHGQINFENVLLDLFFAGSETTSTTLNWAMFFMAKCPHIQEKVHEEINKLTGKSRSITLDDRASTPYLEATIMEIQRLGNVLGLGVPRMANANCNLGNYFIPEGTQLLVCIGADMKSSKFFTNPDEFDPERFLDDEGKFVPNRRIMPYGLGKRRCIGELLARSELYMFFAALMSHFRVVKANASDVLDPTPKLGGTLSPQPYKVRFISRIE